MVEEEEEEEECLLRGPTYGEPLLRPSCVPRRPAEGVLRLTSARVRRIWPHT